MTGEAPDPREAEDCPSGDVCRWSCDQHAFLYYEASVETYPDTPFPAGTQVFAGGQLIGTLGPPLPKTDGGWTNYLIPNKNLTSAPDASPAAEQPAPRT